SGCCGGGGNTFTGAGLGNSGFGKSRCCGGGFAGCARLLCFGGGAPTGPTSVASITGPANWIGLAQVTGLGRCRKSVTACQLAQLSIASARNPTIHTCSSADRITARGVASRLSIGEVLNNRIQRRSNQHLHAPTTPIKPRFARLDCPLDSRGQKIKSGTRRFIASVFAPAGSSVRPSARRPVAATPSPDTPCR